MSERKIEYVPISKLSRGYAGQMINNMREAKSVVYIMRNNEPAAVILSMDDYMEYLEIVRVAKRTNVKERSAKLSGGLRKYADPDKAEKERELYRKDLCSRYGK